MRIFFVLICSLALACVVLGQDQGKKKEQPKKKPAQAQQAGKPTGAGKPAGVGKPAEVGKAKGTGKPTGVGKSAEATQQTEVGKPAGKGKGKRPETGRPAEVGKATGTGKPAEVDKAKGAGKPAEVGKAAGAGKPVTAGGAGGKKYQAQHINLANNKQPKPEVAPAVNFQQNRRIEGSDRWQGAKYQVFRNYRSEWHDRNWWSGHSKNVVFVFGGWYALNAGYWYPAWGYDSNAYYPYDGPIYAYNNLPPDQVIANVQTALQQQGYYQGEIDGLLGPQTRAAIADYQRANGLADTAAIDQPTLQSLGMA